MNTFWIRERRFPIFLNFTLLNLAKQLFFFIKSYKNVNLKTSHADQTSEIWKLNYKMICNINSSFFIPRLYLLCHIQSIYLNWDKVLKMVLGNQIYLRSMEHIKSNPYTRCIGLISLSRLSNLVLSKVKWLYIFKEYNTARVRI